MQEVSPLPLPNHHGIFQFEIEYVQCEYIQEWNSIAFIHSPSPFFEHLFICLSNSCRFLFSYPLLIPISRSYFFMLLESVTCFYMQVILLRNFPSASWLYSEYLLWNQTSKTLMFSCHLLGWCFKVLFENPSPLTAWSTKYFSYTFSLTL